MDIEHIENNEVKDDAFIVEVIDDDDNVLKSRTYDVTITYDFYYRVPRLWLIGYSENGMPLSDNEVKEDIMLEYIDKTVTIEKHPCMGVKSISIHPCKHSMLIKKMISNFEKAGKTLEVEKSIILFLKFLSSVVPTIKYDFTLDIDF
jgi:ubiquitin-like-conjugating enzyme ATG3